MRTACKETKTSESMAWPWGSGVTGLTTGSKKDCRVEPGDGGSRKSLYLENSLLNGNETGITEGF